MAATVTGVPVEKMADTVDGKAVSAPQRTDEICCEPLPVRLAAVAFTVHWG